MDPKQIAEKIDLIIRQINMLDWDEDIDTANSIRLLHEHIVPALEDLANDIYIEEEQRQFSEGCGGLAFCLFCGERFVHSSGHACSEIVLRGKSPKK